MALFRAPPTFPALIDSLRAALRVEVYKGARAKQLYKSEALYADRKIKYSSDSKRGKF